MVALSLDVLECQHDCIQGLALVKCSKVIKAKALIVRLVRTEEVKGQAPQHVEVASLILRKWVDDDLTPGDYRIPFTLEVPRGLPGDAEVERRNIKVSITHWLTLTFLGRRCREVSRQVCLSSEFVAAVSSVKAKRSFATSGFFCFSSSTTHLAATIPSAAIAPDSISIIIEVDSRASRHGLKDLSVMLIQRVSLANGRVYDEKLVAKPFERLRKGKKHIVEVVLELGKHQSTVERAYTCLGKHVKIEYFITLEGRRGKSHFDFVLGSIFLTNFLCWEPSLPKKPVAPEPVVVRRPFEALLLQKSESAIKSQSSPRKAIKYQMQDGGAPEANSSYDNPSFVDGELSGLEGFLQAVQYGFEKQPQSATPNIGQSKGFPESQQAKQVRPSRISIDVGGLGRAPLLHRALSISEFCKIVEAIDAQQLQLPSTS